MWFKNGQIIRSPKGFTKKGIQYPESIFYLWSKAELATLGIKPFVQASPPEGQMVVRSSFEEIDGEVYERLETEPIPDETKEAPTP